MRHVMKRIGSIFFPIFLIISFVTSHHVAQGSYSLESPEVNTNSSGVYLFTEAVGDLLTVDIRDAILDEVLKQVSTQFGIKFLLPPSLGKEKVMVRFSNFKIDDGLNKILAPYNHIFIYSEECHNSHQPPLAKLTEVRIYPRFHEGPKEGMLELASVIRPETSKRSLRDKDNDAKRYGREKLDKSGGRKSLETLSDDLNSSNPNVRLEAVRALAGIRNETAVGLLSSASREDNHPVVRKEAEKALEKMGETLNEDNMFEPRTDADGDPTEVGSPAFAIDYTEQGTPGSSGEVEVDIRLNDVSEELISAGFSINYDPSNVSIISADVYDGSSLPGPWDPGMTRIVKDADGPGTYMVGCGNLGNVSPDGDSNVNLAKIRFTCKGDCNNPITISTISGLDTIVGGNNGHVYDPNIQSANITIP